MTANTKIVTVTSEDSGRRLDNFILNIMKNVPKSRVYRAIRKGEVRVNKKRAKAEYRVKENDLVRIPPIYQPEVKPLVVPSNSLIDLLKTRILYEDDRMLVINKPSGLAVHGGSGIRMGAIEAMRHIYPQLELELAHRLDRDTSGCLMIAKRRSAVRALHEQLRSGNVEKIYHCLVKGQLSKSPYVVEKPLHKNQLVSGERIVRVDEVNGKPSVTIFSTLAQYSHASYLRVELKTGRTHQIRVHSAYLNCPLAGDNKYGDKAFNAKMKNLGLARLFLHAKQLTFKTPDTNEQVTVTAPIDNELLDLLQRLSKQS
jgi:23S rRNA pseudouridine955/2504/2580 synthase